MTYASELQSIARQPVVLVILTMDYCTRSFGVAPCASSGTQCFNTFPTCRDQAHYEKTTKDYKFCSCDAQPFRTGERPYVSAVKYLPTEITTTLTVTGKVQIKFLDEPDNDVGIDPYVTSRSSVQGTFWKKFIARNKNFRRRLVTIKEGFIGLTEGEFETRYIGLIEDMTVNDGVVTLTIIDPIKALSDYESPAKSDCRLGQDIDALVTEFSVSDVDDLSSAGGLVRLGDEIMSYTGYDSTAKQILGVVRAQAGTTADEHKMDATIQPCVVYGPGNPFTIMTQFLSCFVPSTTIDSTAFTRLVTWPRRDPNYYALISEPVDAQKLYFELVQHTLCKSWYSENQKITISKQIAYDPNRSYSTINDAENIMDGSAQVNLHTTSVYSRVYVYWDKVSTGKAGEATSYNQCQVAINADVESSFSYGQTTPLRIYSRWLTSTGTTDTDERLQQYAMNMAKRYLQWHQDPHTILQFNMDLKDEGVYTGSYARISSTEIEDIYGDGISSAVYQIIKRDMQDDGYLKYTAQRIPTKKICLIAPSTAPSFTAATEHEREVYGYVTSTAGQMADGTTGYHTY